MDLFDEFEEEYTSRMRSFRSRESLNKHPPRSPRLSRFGASPKPSERPPTSPGLKPRSHSRQTDTELSASEVHDSPLARIFTRRPTSATDVPEGALALESWEDVLSIVRKVDNMVEGINELPLGQLRTEMKELQVSQL